MTVADDDQYDPLFVLEANFDGKPQAFWAQLDEARWRPRSGVKVPDVGSARLHL